MATNKRKDAAALFELIDKSTLRVPKIGGSLKIPKWFTNTTDAKSPAPPPAPAPPTRPAAAAVSTTRPAPVSGPPIPVTSPKPAPTPLQRTIEGSTLASSAPASFRPPVKPSVATVPPSHPVFAPATSRLTGKVNRSGDMAIGSHRNMKMKFWTMVFSVILLVAVLGAALWFHLQKPVVTARGSLANGTDFTHSSGGVVQPKITSGDTPPQTPKHPNNLSTDGKTRWYGPNEFQRKSELYYLVIESSTSVESAATTARYLADKGVSTSIETQKDSKFIAVLSTDGFAKLSDPNAKSFEAKIKQLGRDHPSSKKRTKPLWHDPYWAQVHQ